MAVHDPAWPDKIMASALMVIMGGFLGTAFVLMRWSGATVELDASPLLAQWPSSIMLVACLAALALGAFAYIHQSWLLAALGIVANVASLGFLGISSLIGLAAIVPLVRSFQEGEETRLDRYRMHAHQWPDKAVVASTLLAVGAMAALMHGLLLLTDRVSTPGALAPAAWGGFSVVAGLVAAAAARQTFHLRRLWLAWTAVLLLAFSLTFYVLGPALAIAVALYLWLAQREGEYLPGRAPEPA